MNLLRLAFKNIVGSGFRSTTIFLCVMGIAGFLLSTTFIIRGSQSSLESGIRRMGAEILIVPEGAEGKFETALLMGRPNNLWMPAENVEKINAFPGVEKVSPQIYFSSLYGSEYCAMPEMFLVIYEPETDFTITPWLKDNLGRSLDKGEVIGGSQVSVPRGEKGLTLYNQTVTLKGNLEPTGTGIDQTIFMTMETARELSRSAAGETGYPLEIPANSVSTILVKTEPGADAHKVTLDLLRETTGMFPIESPSLFGTFRTQMNSLLRGFFVLTVFIWGLATIMMAVNFSMAADERSREMAVLRAVGARAGFIFGLLLTEAGLLAAAGAVAGIVIAASVLFFLGDFFTVTLNMPFLFPSVSSIASLLAAGVSLAVVTVTLSALFPAIRVSRQELAIAMRE